MAESRAYTAIHKVSPCFHTTEQEALPLVPYDAAATLLEESIYAI